MRRVAVIGALSLALLGAGLAEVVVPAAATSDGGARAADAARHAERARKALVKRRWDRAVRESEVASIVACSASPTYARGASLRPRARSRTR